MNFEVSKIARTSADSISLSLPLIAICFTEKLPAGIGNWTGRMPAASRFWQEAATEVFAAAPSDDDLCAIGRFTHNLETTEAHYTNGRDALRVFADPGYVREQDIASMLIFSESFQQVEGSLPPAMERPACAIVPQAINAGRAALSLGCCGSRAYLDALTDEVAIWAISGSKVDLYVESIATLRKAKAILTSFHQMRCKDLEHGKIPTIKESLPSIASWN